MKRFRILVLAALLLLTAALPAWAAPGVTMAVRGANEGRAKQNSWTTVLVELNNQGAELSGELVVRPTVPDGAGGYGSFPEYVVPISLPSGGKKKVPVEVPLQQWNKVRVTLRAGGDVIAEETLTLTMLPGEASLIGVLSGDELGVPALNRSGQAATTHVVRLDADTLPSRAALLNAYNLIALSRFDTATLSKEQVQALEAWVGKGGTLLLAGGPEWKRTFANLPKSLVPVEVTGVGTADLAPLGDLVEKPLKGSGPVSVGRLLRGQALAQSGDTLLMAQDQVGAGKVVYLAGDPGLDPLATWQGQGDLYARYAVAGQMGKLGWEGDVDGMMNNALQRIPGMGLPAVSTIALILLGYLVLVGPLNYIVLKRLDRREWGWVSVPLISVLFVGAVYGLSVGRRTPLLSHIITVTELSPGTGAGTMKTYVGLYAPSRNNLSVPLEGARLVKPLNYYGGPEGGGVSGRVRAGDKTTVELLGFNNYTMKAFSMEHDVTAGGLQLIDVAYSGSTITGRVVNKLNQPVKGARLFSGQSLVELGDIAPGEPSKPFELLLATGGMNPRMGGMPASAFRGPEGPFDEDFFRKEMVWNAAFGYGQVQFKPGTLTVAGWTEKPVTAVKLPDLGQVHHGENLVWGSLLIPIDPANASIPPGIILGVPGSGNLNRTPMGYHVQPGTYTFLFQLPPVDRAKVAEVNLLLNVYNASMNQLSLSAKDRKTGAWVELSAVSDQALPNWQNLIGKEGVLEVKVESTAHFEMAVPTLSVKGVTR